MVATGNKERGDFMSTHPSPPKRIEALQALQPHMKKVYDENLFMQTTALAINTSVLEGVPLDLHRQICV